MAPGQARRSGAGISPSRSLGTEGGEAAQSLRERRRAAAVPLRRVNPAVRSRHP